VPHSVYIHTNHRQMVGAVVAAYALRRNSRHADRFDVHVIEHKDHAFFQAREGQEYLRDGDRQVWRNEDLQSFTPLRFMPPELMGYQGRAVVMDPDIFAVGDIWELLSRDMQGKALMCRSRPYHNGVADYLASSVMLLDCAKLTRWRVEAQFSELFEFKRDYAAWIQLKCEPRETIGLFEPAWNDFDRLNAKTRLLHNTRRRTQPWKTGLPVDYMLADKFKFFPPFALINRARRQMFGDYGLLGRYRRHPDPNQERFFFGLLRECVDQGLVTSDMLRDEMRRNHVRHDVFEVLDRTPPLAAQAVQGAA
jgi:hypothetical protein